jgi:hypothetical protein
MAMDSGTRNGGGDAAGTIVCELGASVAADARLRDALDACEASGADLRVVWVLELPRQDLHGGTAVGTFALPAVLHAALDRACERGISATSAVRFAEREVSLRRAVARCRHCGWLDDARGVHFCPAIYGDAGRSRATTASR